ncbi:LysR substrate-binding domain-containing protein [Amaricoccus sp.]|uniref:LysR substrate-binding domain-containing protein n=1 Tax=Amaricoccus sp. TaxID=1872485 RepID=UPI00261BF02C|nr:LysR substrate-binding domain-containing protein [uncultured Amaricoccus sp.]
MQLRQLRYFVKIVEAGGFSRAAALVHVAQPALSQQIAELEAELGLSLLVRTPRGVRPTPAGEILCREAAAILRQIDALPAVLRSAGGELEGVVRIGFSSTLASTLGAPLLDACRATMPKVTLRLATADSLTLGERLRAGQLDLLLAFEDEPAPGFTRWPLFRQRFYFIHRERLAAPDAALTLEAIAAHPLVLPVQPNVARAPFDRLLAAAGLTPQVVAEADLLSSILAAVQAGLGGTLLPKGDLSDVPGFEALTATPVEPPIHLTAVLLASAERPLAAVAEAVRAVAVTVIRDRLAAAAPPGVELVTPTARP